MASKKPYSELTRSGKCRRLLKLKQVSYSIGNNSHQNTPSCQEYFQNSIDVEPLNHETNKSNYVNVEIDDFCLTQNPESWWDEGSFEETESEEDEDDNLESNLSSQKLHEDIKNWAFQFHITNIALSALLLILKANGIADKSMPIDARTLLKTPASINTHEVSPGIYYHIGFQQGLKKIWHKVTESVSNLEILVGIDGLPLFRSSKSELWPILVSVLNIPSIATEVFPIGIYYGKKKPSSSKNFLERFIADIKTLLEEGILLNGKTFLVTLKGFCCDAPAKAFILGIKGHTGYSSCTKCKQEGHHTNNRIVFPEIPDRERLQFLLRSSEGFLRQDDPNHHNTESPLISIPNLDFISAFPLDYMHLVCLGVMRSLLYIWIYAIPHKLPQRLVDSISSRLINLRHYIPSEFCRKPRSLEDIKRWKATELRQFLLYTGPVVLKNVLHTHMYSNFLELHVAIRILTDPKHCQIHRLYAQDLLIHFLRSFKSIYGQIYMTHNFHGLLHLSDSVSTFGPLDRCSAFRFENHLYSMKKLIRKGDKPLQQLVKRLEEQSQFNASSRPTHQEYPFCSSPDLASSNSFKKIHFKDYVLSNTLSNACCKITDGSIVIIKNIRHSEGSIPLITCKKFTNYQDFFGNPLCQSSSIGIHTVSSLLQSDEEVAATEVVGKLVLLPLNGGTDESLVLPLLHSE